MPTSLDEPRATKRVTLDATAGEVTELTVPSHARELVLYFDGGPGKYSFADETEGSAMSDDHMPVPGNTPVRVKITGKSRPNGTTALYVAGTLASQKLHVDVLGVEF